MDKIMLQHCQKHGGFSLLELMLAIAIFCIIGTVAVPSFRSWSRTYQLRSAANDLCSYMQMAKIRAVKENRPWTVNFNPDGMLGYTIKYDNQPPDSVKKVDFRSKYNQEIQFTKSPTSSVPFDTATLRFNPNGTVVSGDPNKPPAFAYLSNNAKSGYYKVGLSFSNGAILLQKWDGSQWK